MALHANIRSSDVGQLNTTKQDSIGTCIGVSVLSELDTLNSA